MDWVDLNESLVRKIVWFCATALVTTACSALAAFLAIALGEGHDKVQVLAFVIGVPLAFIASALFMIRRSRRDQGSKWAAAGTVVPLLMMAIGLA